MVFVSFYSFQPSSVDLDRIEGGMTENQWPVFGDPDASPAGRLTERNAGLPALTGIVRHRAALLMLGDLGYGG